MKKFNDDQRSKLLSNVELLYDLGIAHGVINGTVGNFLTRDKLIIKDALVECYKTKLLELNQGVADRSKWNYELPFDIELEMLNGDKLQFSVSLSIYNAIEVKPKFDISTDAIGKMKLQDQYSLREVFGLTDELHIELEPGNTFGKNVNGPCHASVHKKNDSGKDVIVGGSKQQYWYPLRYEELRQIHDEIKTNGSVALVHTGATGSGKTGCYSILARALELTEISVHLAVPTKAAVKQAEDEASRYGWDAPSAKRINREAMAKFAENTKIADDKLKTDHACTNIWSIKEIRECIEKLRYSVRRLENGNTGIDTNCTSALSDIDSTSKKNLNILTWLDNLISNEKVLNNVTLQELQSNSIKGEEANSWIDLAEKRRKAEDDVLHNKGALDSLSKNIDVIRQAPALLESLQMVHDQIMREQDWVDPYLRNLHEWTKSESDSHLNSSTMKEIALYDIEKALHKSREDITEKKRTINALKLIKETLDASPKLLESRLTLDERNKRDADLNNCLLSLAPERRTIVDLLKHDEFADFDKNISNILCETYSSNGLLSELQKIGSNAVGLLGDGIDRICKTLQNDVENDQKLINDVTDNFAIVKQHIEKLIELYEERSNLQSKARELEVSLGAYNKEYGNFIRNTCHSALQNNMQKVAQIYGTIEGTLREANAPSITTHEEALGADFEQHSHKTDEVFIVDEPQTIEAESLQRRLRLLSDGDHQIVSFTATAPGYLKDVHGDKPRTIIQSITQKRQGGSFGAAELCDAKAQTMDELKAAGDISDVERCQSAASAAVLALEECMVMEDKRGIQCTFDASGKIDADTAHLILNAVHSPGAEKALIICDSERHAINLQIAMHDPTQALSEEGRGVTASAFANDAARAQWKNSREEARIDAIADALNVNDQANADLPEDQRKAIKQWIVENIETGDYQRKATACALHNCIDQTLCMLLGEEKDGEMLPMQQHELNALRSGSYDAFKKRVEQKLTDITIDDLVQTINISIPEDIRFAERVLHAFKPVMAVMNQFKEKQDYRFDRLLLNNRNDKLINDMMFKQDGVLHEMLAGCKWKAFGAMVDSDAEHLPMQALGDSQAVSRYYITNDANELCRVKEEKIVLNIDNMEVYYPDVRSTQEIPVNEATLFCPIVTNYVVKSKNKGKDQTTQCATTKTQNAFAAQCKAGDFALTLSKSLGTGHSDRNLVTVVSITDDNTKACDLIQHYGRLRCLDTTKKSTFVLAGKHDNNYAQMLQQVTQSQDAGYFGLVTAQDVEDRKKALRALSDEIRSAAFDASSRMRESVKVEYAFEDFKHSIMAAYERAVIDSGYNYEGAARKMCDTLHDLSEQQSLSTVQLDMNKALSINTELDKGEQENANAFIRLIKNLYESLVRQIWNPQSTEKALRKAADQAEAGEKCYAHIALISGDNPAAYMYDAVSGNSRCAHIEEAFDKIPDTHGAHVGSHIKWDDIRGEDSTADVKLGRLVEFYCDMARTCAMFYYSENKTTSTSICELLNKTRKQETGDQLAQLVKNDLCSAISDGQVTTLGQLEGFIYRSYAHHVGEMHTELMSALIPSLNGPARDASFAEAILGRVTHADVVGIGTRSLGQIYAQSVENDLVALTLDDKYLLGDMACILSAKDKVLRSKATTNPTTPIQNAFEVCKDEIAADIESLQMMFGNDEKLFNVTANALELNIRWDDLVRALRYAKNDGSSVDQIKHVVKVVGCMPPMFSEVQKCYTHYSPSVAKRMAQSGLGVDMSDRPALLQNANSNSLLYKTKNPRYGHILFKESILSREVLKLDAHHKEAHAQAEQRSVARGVSKEYGLMEDFQQAVLKPMAEGAGQGIADVDKVSSAAQTTGNTTAAESASPPHGMSDKPGTVLHVDIPKSARELGEKLGAVKALDESEVISGEHKSSAERVLKEIKGSSGQRGY